MLLSGAIAGPLFILTVLIQDYTRSGFDPRRHMLSLLSLGRLGWIQVANFVVTGFLNVLYSFGLRRRLEGTKAGAASSLLICVYGLGLILVGIFRTDPADGFPPDVPAVKPPSPHGVVHGLGALVVFVGLSASLVSLSRSLAAMKERACAGYCLASAVAMLTIFFTGFANPAATARTLRLAVLVGWSAASIVAGRLLTDEKAFHSAC
jgi:hypothetical membrane protein